MRRPVFSVIIPMYNSEKYIGECISSITSQSFPDFEIVIVDDGSQDNSYHVAEEYAAGDARIKVVSQSNQGPGVARNLGLEISKGLYIAFLDADDFWINDNILSEIYLLIKERHCSVIGTEIAEFKDGDYDITRYKGLDGEDYKTISFERIGDDPFWFTSYFYKRELIIENNIQFPPTRLNEDPPFLAQIIGLANEFVYYPKQFYAYRKGHKLHRILSASQIKDYLYGMDIIFSVAQQHARKKMRDWAIDSIYRVMSNRIVSLIQEGDLICLGRLLGICDKYNIDCGTFEQFDYLLEAVKEKPLHDVEALIKKANTASEVYIYGAGVYGRLLYEQLKKADVSLCKVKFVVTKLSGKETVPDGIECLQIDSIKNRKENIIMFIAVKEDIQGEMEITARENGFGNLYLLNNNQRKALKDLEKI